MRQVLCSRRRCRPRMSPSIPPCYRYKIFGAPQVVSLTSSATTVAPIGTRSSRGKLSFSYPGTALHWRATLVSTDLVTTPVLEIIRIDYATSEQTSQ